MLEIKLLEVCFQPVPRGRAGPERPFPSNSVIQHSRKLPCEPSHLPAHGSCDASDFFRPFANPQLITHLLFQSSGGVIIVRAMCSRYAALPQYAALFVSRLPATGLAGNIKPEGRNRHTGAAAVHLCHIEHSQVHGPQFYKHGSITKSSLLSGLQASLNRILTFTQILYQMFSKEQGQSESVFFR